MHDRKRLIAVALLPCLGVAAAAPAQAPDRWIPIGTTDTGTFSVDRETIRRDGDRVTVWERRIRAQPTANGTRENRTQWEYDCAAMTQSLLAGVSLDERGNEIAQYSVSPARQTRIPIDPESMAERVARTVCPRR